MQRRHGAPRDRNVDGVGVRVVGTKARMAEVRVHSRAGHTVVVGGGFLETAARLHRRTFLPCRGSVRGGMWLEPTPIPKARQAEFFGSEIQSFAG